MAASHRSVALSINGTLQVGEQSAIDYVQIGTNGTCCHGPVTELSSWWGYGQPIVAAAGVVAAVVDGLPDEQPVGTKNLVPLANYYGNSIAPHMDFQVMNAPSPFDATGLRFVFD